MHKGALFGDVITLIQLQNVKNNCTNCHVCEQGWIQREG